MISLIPAGIMFGKRKLTDAGFERQMAVNYLGHFALTHMLLPLLKKAGMRDRMARVVNVSSCAHYVGSWLDFDDIHMQ